MNHDTNRGDIRSAGRVVDLADPRASTPDQHVTAEVTR